MVVLTVVVQLILAAQTSRDVDRVLEDRADAVAGSTTSEPGQGALSVPQADLDRGVVVYAADGTLVAGTAMCFELDGLLLAGGIIVVQVEQ